MLFLSTKNPEKQNVLVSTNMWSSTKIKIFSEQQISILEWSLKDHVTLKTRVMMLWSQELIAFYNILQSKTVHLNWNRILQYFCFHCIFDQINAALGNLVKNTIFEQPCSCIWKCIWTQVNGSCVCINLIALLATFIKKGRSPSGCFWWWRQWRRRTQTARS